MTRFPKDLDRERLAITLILVASINKPGMKINHARLWHRLSTEPILVQALLSNPQIATLYTRLGLSADRRKLLDSAQWG